MPSVDRTAPAVAMRKTWGDSFLYTTQDTDTAATASAHHKVPPTGLGSLLKAARKRTGMTQGQLADLSSVSVRAIRDLELDLTRNPRRETLRLLLDGLRLTGARRAEIEEAVAGMTPWGTLADTLTPPPAALGPIIGREHDVEALTRLLESGGHRLIRVVGVAGVGKSRLIQEVAAATHAGRRMPVVWLEARSRATGRSADSLHGQIAALLRGEPELDSLVAAFGTSDALLVVSGQALSSGAETALRQLLERCPGLRALHETRESPRRSEGTDYPVFPLPVSDPVDGTAILDPAADLALQLMVSHCERLGSDPASLPRTMTALADVCRSLDGIPQAIESAASWLLLFEPPQLLDIAVRDPFRLTTPPASQGAPDLRAALAASVNSLRPQDAEILHRLAASPRPWTMAHALSTLGHGKDSGLGTIHLLCTRGLVRPAGRTSDGTPRFTVLHLVRLALAEGGAPAPRAVASVLPQQVPVTVNCRV